MTPIVITIDGLFLAKLLTMTILGLGSFLLGVLPIQLTKKLRVRSFSPAADNHSPGPDGHGRDDGHDRQRGHSHAHPGDSATGSRAVSLLLCFGGGVLLCTTLLHLMPEVREGVAYLQETGAMPENEHLADMLLCAGFFVVFIVDEVAHAVVHCFNAPSSRRPDAVLNRSVSLRRSLGLRKSATKKADGDGDCEDDRDRGEQPQAAAPAAAAAAESPDRYRQPADAENDRHSLAVAEPDGHEDLLLRGFFTVFALSVHEVFEGMTIGLSNTVDHVWLLFFAVASHKLVIAFCIGLELAWADTRSSVIMLYVSAFSVVTPVGALIGMIISTDGQLTANAVVLQGLAAGTLLYVVFFEVLGRHKRPGWKHLLAVTLGFGLLLSLQLIIPHEHHHGVDHGHSHSIGHSHGHGVGPVNDHHSSHDHFAVHDHSGDGHNDDHHGHDHSGHGHTDDHHGHDHSGDGHTDDHLGHDHSGDGHTDDHHGHDHSGHGHTDDHHGHDHSGDGHTDDHYGHDHSGHGHTDDHHGHDHSGHGHTDDHHGHDHSGDGHTDDHHGHDHSGDGHTDDHHGHDHSRDGHTDDHHGHDHSGDGHTDDHHGHDHSGDGHTDDHHGHDHSGDGHTDDHHGHDHSGDGHTDDHHGHDHSGDGHTDEHHDAQEDRN